MQGDILGRSWSNSSRMNGVVVLGVPVLLIRGNAKRIYRNMLRTMNSRLKMDPRRVWCIRASVICCLATIGFELNLAAEETDVEGSSGVTHEQKQEKNAEDTSKDEGKEVEEGLTLDEILSGKPDSSDYRSTKSCIDRRRVDSYDAINDRLIAFKMRNGDRYLVLLRTECHGLGAGRKLRIDTHGTLRICRGDTVRAFTNDFNRDAWGPPCLIPGFEPVTQHQLDQLEVGIKSGRVN